MTQNNADALRTWRATRGLTQAQAARYLGVPLRSLQNWETGHRAMPASATSLLTWVQLVESLAPSVADTLMRVRLDRPPGRNPD